MNPAGKTKEADGSGVTEARSVPPQAGIWRKAAGGPPNDIKV